MSELPPGWAFTTLGTVAVLVNGSTPKGVLDAPSGPIPFYKVGDMNLGNGTFMANSRVTLSVATVSELGLRLFPPGTVIFPKVGGALNTNKKRILTRRAAVDTNTMVAVPTSIIDQRFLYYWLCSIRLSAYAHGSPVPSISRRRFAEAPLALPPYQEQRRIVGAIEEQFSQLDTAMAALEQARKKLDQMRRAVLQTVFAKHLVDAPTALLSDAASTQLGRMLSARRETGEHAKPYLRNRDVQWGHVHTKDLPVMDFAGADAKRFRLNHGDVLICEGGEIGRAAVWTAPIVECYFQKAVHRVRCSAELDPYFLRYLLEYYARTRAFDRFASGSTIAHLPQEDLRRLPVPMPSVAEQQATVSVVERQFSALDHLLDSITSLTHRAATLRASVFAAAFSGELVPQNSCEEQASVLLERIEAERVLATRHKSTKLAANV